MPRTALTHTDPTQTRIQLVEALQFLDANCDRSEWIAVGAALKTEFSDHEGLILFHGYSSRGHTYNQRTTLHQWNSFKPGLYNAGTIFYLAERYGWTRPKFEPLSHEQRKHQQQLKQQEIQERQRRRRQHQREMRLNKALKQRSAMLILDSASAQPRPALLQRYLRQRGIALPDAALPYAKPCYGYQKLNENGDPTKIWQHAIVHPIHDGDGEIVGAHAILLDKHARKRYARSFGTIRQGIIRLSPDEHWELTNKRTILHVSEGIENRLSTAQYTDAETHALTRSAAAINATELGRLIVPADTTKLIIDVDKDRSHTGEKAALGAFRNNGITTILNLPPGPPGTDWNDALCKPELGLQKRAKAVLAMEPIALLPNLSIRGEAADIKKFKALPQFQKLTRKTQPRQDYVSELIAKEPIPQGISMIRLNVGMGRGKTEFCKQLVESADKVLITSHRVFLTLNTKERMGVLHYHDLPKGPISLAEHNKVVTCIDSLTRIVSHSYDGQLFEGLDLLVIDEASKVRDAIYKSQHIESGKSLEIHQRLRYQLQAFAAKGGKIVLADADLTPETSRYFQELAGLSDDQVHAIDSPSLPLQYNVHLAPDHETLLDRLSKAAESGQTLYMPCTSVRDATAIAARLAGLDPNTYAPEEADEEKPDEEQQEKQSKRRNKKQKEQHDKKQRELFYQLLDQGILLLTRHTKGFSEAKTAIADPNAEWPRYQHVITSPVMESGVDFSVPDHFDAIYCCARRVPTLGRSNLTQLIGRVRQIKNNDLYLWVQEYRDRRTLDHDKLHDQVREHLRKTDNAFRIYVDPLTGTVEEEPEDEAHFEGMIGYELDRRRDCRNVKRDLLAYFKSFGCEILELPALQKKQKQAIQHQHQALKEEIDAAEDQRIIDAKEISFEEAQALSNSPFLEAEQERQITRAMIQHEWGVVDTERCEAWRNKEQHQTRNLALLMVLMMSPELRHLYLKRCATKDRDSFSAGSLVHVSHHTRKALFLEKLWQILTMVWAQPNHHLDHHLKGLGEKDLSPDHHQDSHDLDLIKNPGGGPEQAIPDDLGYRSGAQLMKDRTLMQVLDEIYAEENVIMRRMVGLHGHIDAPVMEKLGRIMRLFGIRREKIRRREEGKKQHAYRPSLPSLYKTIGLSLPRVERELQALRSWVESEPQEKPKDPFDSKTKRRRADARSADPDGDLGQGEDRGVREGLPFDEPQRASQALQHQAFRADRVVPPDQEHHLAGVPEDQSG